MTDSDDDEPLFIKPLHILNVDPPQREGWTSLNVQSDRHFATDKNSIISEKSPSAISCYINDDFKVQQFKPLCITYQDKPCLQSFDCADLNSPTISNRIIDYFANIDYNYIMPDCNKYDYVFCRNSKTISCYLYKNPDFETDEITVCLNGSTHQIFADLRDLFRPKFQTPAHDFSHMTALEILLKYY